MAPVVTIAGAGVAKPAPLAPQPGALDPSANLTRPVVLRARAIYRSRREGESGAGSYRLLNSQVTAAKSIGPLP